MLMIVMGSVVGVLIYYVHFKTMSVAPMASLFFITLFQFVSFSIH